MADVRVRVPLVPLAAASLQLFQDVGKSGIPRASGARDRWFKSSRPDCVASRTDGDCGGTRAGTGRRLLTALTTGSIPAPAVLVNTNDYCGVV